MKLLSLKRIHRLFLPLLLPLILNSCGDPASQNKKKEPPPPPQTYLDFQPVSMDNLDAFQATDGNWTVAGSVFADRTADNKTPIKGETGTGILVNNNDESKKSHLLTTMEHGDIEVDMEFMMAKGSNSGVYLQGRYEIQLFDSWGVAEPKHSDVGGIYQRWDESRPEGQKGFEGHAPPVNASRAPGLWQHLRIRFQAPRFDANGNKTANARFLKVELNGTLLHEDVEVTGPTRAAMFEDEQATGPLMIQGDHGPVAIRNLGIKQYGDKKLTLSPMEFKYYELESNTTAEDNLPDFSTLTPARTGSTDSLSRNVIEERRNYGLVFDGSINVPESGTYLLEAMVQGGIKVLIGGKVVLDYDGEHEFVGEVGYGKAELSAGEQPFQVLYRKQHRFWKNGLALFVEGPGIPKMALHAPGSPMQLPDFQPYAIGPEENEATVLRGYVMHDGYKRTHAVSVGNPEGVHFNYDLNQGAWLTVWDGAFVDVREMWVNRGVEQIAVPMGPALGLGGMPSFAQLSGKNAAWPDSVYEGDPIQFAGYELGENGAPTFLFEAGSGTIKDQISPSSTERKLTRSITAEGNIGKTWVLLASGSDIQQLPNGSYAINDHSYYLETGDGTKPVIRSNDGQQELVLSLSDNQSINYSLIW